MVKSHDKGCWEMDGFNWYISDIINRIWWMFDCGQWDRRRNQGCLGLGSGVDSGLIQWDRDFED